MIFFTIVFICKELLCKAYTVDIIVKLKHVRIYLILLYNEWLTIITLTPPKKKQTNIDKY